MIKSGVRLIGLQPQMVLAYGIIEPILRKYNQPAVITSGSDGHHSNRSRHYSGQGLDFRTRDMEVSNRSKATAEIKEALGEEFYVAFEINHIHVQFHGSVENG